MIITRVTAACDLEGEAANVTDVSFHVKAEVRRGITVMKCLCLARINQRRMNSSDEATKYSGAIICLKLFMHLL